NLENEGVSEPFAEPTPISQTMSSSLIDEESEKPEPSQPASRLSPAPKKRNEEKPQPNLENEGVSEPFAEPTPISQKMSGWLIDEESEKSEPSQAASRLSPAPKKTNQQNTQPNLKNDGVSEPFAEPTPISQTKSSSAKTMAAVSTVPKPTPS